MTPVACLLAALSDITGVAPSAKVADGRVHVGATSACGLVLDAGWFSEASLDTDGGFSRAVETFAYGLTCSCTTCRTAKREARAAKDAALSLPEAIAEIGRLRAELEEVEDERNQYAAAACNG